MTVPIGMVILATAVLLTSCAVDRKRAMEARRTHAFDLYTQGQMLESQGRHEEALDAYTRALELSERPAFFYKVGRMHHQLGRPGQALPYYEQAIELVPHFELAQAHRDLALLELRESELLEQSEEDAPAEPDQTGSVPPAPAVVATDRPTTPAAPVSAREILTPRERIDDEQVRRAVFPELFAESPVDLETLRERAMAATEAGRWSDASIEWTQVVNRVPGDVDARLELGWAFAKSNRTRRALEEFRTAASLAPQRADVRLRWGNALMEAGRWEDAGARYLEALDREPGNVRALNNLGALALQHRRYAESAAYLERLLEIEPLFVPAHLNLALALSGAGTDSARAIHHLETYLRLGGENRDEAERWLVRLRSGRDGDVKN